MVALAKAALPADLESYLVASSNGFVDLIDATYLKLGALTKRTAILVNAITETPARHPDVGEASQRAADPIVIARIDPL